jgi:hypothetical protein
LRDESIVGFLTTGNLRASRLKLVSSATITEGEQKLEAGEKDSEREEQEKQIRHACIVPGETASSSQ